MAPYVPKPRPRQAAASSGGKTPQGTNGGARAGRAAGTGAGPSGSSSSHPTHDGLCVRARAWSTRQPRAAAAARAAAVATLLAIPAVSTYGALALWQSADDASPLRAGAMVITGLAVAADMFWKLGPLWAGCLVVAFAALAVGLSAGYLTPWWQAVVMLVAVFWYLVRRTVPCGCRCACKRGGRGCGRASSDGSGGGSSAATGAPVADAEEAAGAPPPPTSGAGAGPALRGGGGNNSSSLARPEGAGGEGEHGGGPAAAAASATSAHHRHHRHDDARHGRSCTRSHRCCYGGCCECRPQYVALGLARAMEAVTLLLLLPALAAQLTELECLPQGRATDTAATVKFYDRYMRGADDGAPSVTGGRGTGRNWAPPNGSAVLFRVPADANATYATWVPSQRAVYFSGTHTARQVQLDFDLAPQALAYAAPTLELAPGGTVPTPTGPACGSLTVSRGFWRTYADVRPRVAAAVAGALAANASAPVFVGGFSLGGAQVPVAAIDLVCSGVAAPSQLAAWSEAPPAACAAGACPALLQALQARGLAYARVVNPFDVVPWLPAFLYEAAPAGRGSASAGGSGGGDGGAVPATTTVTGGTYLTFTHTGQLVLLAHTAAGYITYPFLRGSPMSPCAQLRALAWLPVLVAAAVWALLALGVDRGCGCAAARREQKHGSGGGGGGGMFRAASSSTVVLEMAHLPTPPQPHGSAAAAATGAAPSAGGTGARAPAEPT